MVHEGMLLDFLISAKRKTYASKSNKPIKLVDGGEEFVYRVGDFIYKDKYFGSNVFTGQERVSHNGKLIWSMAYRGGMVQGFEILSKKCYNFLRSCLKKIPVDFPVRGPLSYKRGNFRYVNNFKGNLIDFVGVEKIYWKDRIIYFCNYFGGKAELRNSNLAS